MSMVMFATICDHPGCPHRSREYMHWPTCRECLLDTCDLHEAPGSLKQDDEGRESCLCVSCAELEVQP